MTTRLSCLLACLAALLPAAESPDANVFTNAPDKAKAPVVQEGELFKATIKVKNPYDRAIKITTIEESCACAEKEIGSRFLLPGEETTVMMASTTDDTSGEQIGKLWFFTSDPSFEPLETRFLWRVHPKVTVDLLPPNTAPDKAGERPAKIAYRDIYRYQSAVKPDQQRQLVKNILVACPEDQVPPDGLTVEVAYEGKYWTFTAKPLGRDRVLLLARPAIKEGEMPAGAEDAVVTVSTNHPGKRRLTLEFWTVVDPRAGTSELPDPYKSIKEARKAKEQAAKEKAKAAAKDGTGGAAAAGEPAPPDAPDRQ